MPGLNRTGPTGAGPMTGRQHGRCTGNVSDFPIHRFRNFRHEFRGGRGYGFRRENQFRFYESNFAHDVSDETLLENEARILKEQLSRVETELEKIHKGKREE